MWGGRFGTRSCLPRNGWSEYSKKKNVLTFRNLFTSLCSQDILVHIIDARFFLTPYTVCAVVFQSDNCEQGSIGNDYLEWTISIDEKGRRPNNGSKNNTPKASTDDLVIVQITDTHFDPHYREGANAVCGEPACCREKQVKLGYLQCSY